MRDGMKPFTFETSVSVASAAPPDAVFEVVTELPAHLEWSGERASDDAFKLLGLEAQEDRARVGTTFSSSGANFNGTFHDRSVEGRRHAHIHHQTAEPGTPTSGSERSAEKARSFPA